MKTCNKRTCRTLDRITADLNVGQSRIIDNAHGSFMAVHVEHLTLCTFSLAHYFEQNEDLCADPEMGFYRAIDGTWYPLHFQQDSIGYYREAYRLGSDGTPSHVNVRVVNDLVPFVNTWCQNIEEQQGV